MRVRITNLGDANLSSEYLYFQAVNLDTQESVTIYSDGYDEANYAIFTVPRCSNGYSNPMVMCDGPDYVGSVYSVVGMNSGDINTGANAVYQSCTVEIWAEEPIPETVHATIYFNDEPTTVQFSDGQSVYYEYEQTSAQTFELDVPPMQDLYVYAECEGYDPLDAGWSVQATDFEAAIDFTYHYTITVYDEDGELIPDGDENLEIYDNYWEEMDHSNPFVIREITPGSSFNITVSYPSYLTQSNSVTVDNNDDS